MPTATASRKAKVREDGTEALEPDLLSLERLAARLERLSARPRQRRKGLTGEPIGGTVSNRTGEVYQLYRV